MVRVERLVQKVGFVREDSAFRLVPMQRQRCVLGLVWISKRTQRIVGRVETLAAKIADAYKAAVNVLQDNKPVRVVASISPMIGRIAVVATMLVHKDRCVCWGNVKRNVP